MYIIFSLFSLFYLLSKIECANILIAIPYAGKSHYLIQRPLGLELAKRGHNVTVVAAFEEDSPPQGYRQIIIDSKNAWTLKDTKYKDIYDVDTFEKNVDFVIEAGIKVAETALSSDAMQNLLDDDTNTFDIVITNLLIHEGLYMLSHKYNAPLILFSPGGYSMRSRFYMNDPLELTTLPHEFSRFTQSMSFFQICLNVYYFLYEIININLFYTPKLEKLMKKYYKKLPEPVPSIDQLKSNVSLVLLNSHFSVDEVSNYSPGVVEVGGLQLVNVNTTLPQNLQVVLDNAIDGAIYMSFGSNIKHMSQNKLETFIKVFSQLKYTILWKWDDIKSENIPPNVHIRKWFPQTAILAHKNIKAFITHGGHLSMHEAVYFGVPLLGIPLLLDQWRNVMAAKHAGYGKILTNDDFSESFLRSELLDIVNNQTYKNIAQDYSTRFRDRPHNALDSAVYWIEYVTKYGANAFRKPQKSSVWYSRTYNMSDIIMTIVFLSILLFAINFMFKCVSGIKL